MRSRFSKRRRGIALIGLLSVGTFLALFTVAGAGSVSRAPDVVPAGAKVRGAALAAPKEHCRETPSTAARRDKQRNVNRIPGPKEQTVCGTNDSDVIDAEGKNTVLARWGDDVIHADNRSTDTVYGHHGYDKAFLDNCDKLPTGHSIEKVIRRGRCRDFKPQKTASLAAIHYPYWYSSMECQKHPDVAGWYMIRFAEEPTIRAVDSSRQVDWQRVAWTGLLYTLVNGAWVQASPTTPGANRQTEWLWDRTYDEQVGAFPGNLWRRFTTNERWFTWFNIKDPGSYRVAVQSRWYRPNGSVQHDELDWAGSHFGEFETPGKHESCTFPPLVP